MKRRKWTISLSAILLAMLMTTGYLAIYAEYGSKEDPLVSLSYINDVLAPDTTKKINEAFAAKKTELEKELDAKVAALKVEVERLIAQNAGSSGTAVSDEIVNKVVEQVAAKLRAEGGAGATETTWKVVKLKKGQVLTGEVGCEVLLRFGSATCVASGTPGLVNLSSGTDLASGGALTANHLYLVTVAGRGVKAAADTTLLANGAYSVK